MREFHVEQVVQGLDAEKQMEIDSLPIGMIELDREGKILRYNKTEGELARRDPQKQIGKSFFDEVAPCTKVKAFHGRFVEGVKNGTLNETFAYTFDFPFGRLDVVITLFFSKATSTVWVLVSHKKEAPLARKR